VGELGHREYPSTRFLDFSDTEEPLTALNQHDAVTNGDNGAIFDGVHAFLLHVLGRVDAKALPVKRSLRDWPGIEGPHLALDARGWMAPVDAGLGLLDLGSVGDALRRLRLRRRAPRG
jgi:hypothetical protein